MTQGKWRVELIIIGTRTRTRDRISVGHRNRTRVRVRDDIKNTYYSLGQ
jgi:hypothetical protein